MTLDRQVAGRACAGDSDEGTLLAGGDVGLHQIHRLEVAHPVDRVEALDEAHEDRERPRIDAMHEDRLDQRDVVELGIGVGHGVACRELPGLALGEVVASFEPAELDCQRPFLRRRRPRHGLHRPGHNRTHVLILVHGRGTHNPDITCAHKALAAGSSTDREPARSIGGSHPGCV